MRPATWSANSASSACSPRPPIRAPAHGIPYLRRKLAAVEQRAGFDPGSHSGKALANVLEHYPRDELFQIDEQTLYRFAIAILQLDERPRVRVLARRDRFDRFVSVMVFVPRENYDSQMRVKIGAYLASVFLGRVSAFYPFFPEGPLVRVHFIIGRSGGATRGDRARHAWKTQSRPSCAAGPMGFPMRWRWSIRRPRRTNCSRATATPFRPDSTKPIRRSRPPTTSASSKS